MSRLACALAALVALGPSRVAAQGFGLDLSEDPDKKPEKPGPSGLPPPLELSPPPKPAEGELTEKDIATEDRVKSVQRKPLLKTRRFELSPMFFVSMNDAFFPKVGPGLRGVYHLTDSVGAGVRFFQYHLVPSDNVRLAKRQLQSRLPYVLPRWSASLDVLWSPIYGKVSVFNDIRHFDLYLVGGAGLLGSQITAQPGRSPNLETHIGLGQRFGLFDFLSFDLSLIEVLYSDRPGDGIKSVVQHVVTLNVGVSLFLPPRFEYRAP